MSGEYRMSPRMASLLDQVIAFNGYAKRHTDPDELVYWMRVFVDLNMLVHHAD